MAHYPQGENRKMPKQTPEDLLRLHYLQVHWRALSTSSKAQQAKPDRGFNKCLILLELARFCYKNCLVIEEKMCALAMNVSGEFEHQMAKE